MKLKSKVEMTDSFFYLDLLIEIVYLKYVNKITKQLLEDYYGKD